MRAVARDTENGLGCVCIVVDMVVCGNAELMVRGVLSLDEAIKLYQSLSVAIRELSAKSDARQGKLL